MRSPQLDFYAAARAGRTAIIHTSSRRVIAWIERDGDTLRARNSRWVSGDVETVPQAVAAAAEWFYAKGPDPRTS